DLHQRILKLAGALLNGQVKPGTHVGVIEWDSHRYLEMYFAIAGMGAVMHCVNPGLAAEAVLYTINHAEDEILIFHQDFIPLVEKMRLSLPTVKRFILIKDDLSIPVPSWVNEEYEEWLVSAAPVLDLQDMDENSLATLSYTTGTTGKPKGVFFSQRQITLQTLSDSIALSALGSYGGINKHDIYMPLTPMYHGHAWGMPYVATLWGIKQVFPGKYNYQRILGLIQKEHITFSHCVPVILKMILDRPEINTVDLRDWKVIVGGSTLSESLASEARAKGIKVFGGYGLSETCPVLTIANLKPFMETWEDEKQLSWLTRPGFSLPLVYIKVVNEDGQEVKADLKETGEILVRTPWCTPAYYKENVLSDELWSDGWLHTGDVATVDAYGYIKIVDRLKDVIKSGGEWIVSLELEKLILQCDGVADAAVIGIPHEKWGERPLAIIKARPGYEDNLTHEIIKAHLKKYVEAGLLAAWALPDSCEFVKEIPLTGAGKHNKKLLREKYLFRA
ncbi:MAG: long-chain-fatty-acid--CoA ligase, partial [Anaerolineae bacterium]|nr:long-chain-fatty-acid--CoA ligase [Anaerolineae bacterium]